MKTLKIPQIHWGSATELPYPDDFFDAVLTDPPYYDGTRSAFSTVAIFPLATSMTFPTFPICPA